MSVVEIDQKMVAQFREKVIEDQEEALKGELLRKVVQPVLEEIQSLVSQNPEAAKRGFKVITYVQVGQAKDEFLTTAEVARKFRVSQQQVRRWCATGKIIAEPTPGGTWRIPAAQFGGTGAFVPFGERNKPKDIRTVAGAWKDRPDLIHALEEQRDE